MSYHETTRPTGCRLTCFFLYFKDEEEEEEEEEDEELEIIVRS